MKEFSRIKRLPPYVFNSVNELKVDVVGLMCIPPIEVKPDDIFKTMKELSDKVGLEELSMGMSSDYFKAVENDATFLRIGSSIFGQRY